MCQLLVGRRSFGRREYDIAVEVERHDEERGIWFERLDGGAERVADGIDPSQTVHRARAIGNESQHPLLTSDGSGDAIVAAERDADDRVDLRGTRRQMRGVV